MRKTDAAVDGVRRLNPEVTAVGIFGDFRHTMGLGFYRRADVIIGCLDSREARLALNRRCFRAGKPWMDGALHGLLGEARVFRPDAGACYECTLTPADYRSIALRYSCQSIRRDQLPEIRIPTTPTSAAMVAAAETQDALKIVHGLPVEGGRAQVFNGMTNECYSIGLKLREGCQSHETWAPVEEWAVSAASVAISDLVRWGRERLGGDPQIYLGFDLVVRFECSCEYGTVEVLRPALGSGSET